MTTAAPPPPSGASRLLVCCGLSALLAATLTVGVGLARGDASLPTLIQRALVSGGLAIIGTVLIMTTVGAPRDEPRPVPQPQSPEHERDKEPHEQA